MLRKYARSDKKKIYQDRRVTVSEGVTTFKTVNVHFIERGIGPSSRPFLDLQKWGWDTEEVLGVDERFVVLPVRVRGPKILHGLQTTGQNLLVHFPSSVQGH